MQKRGFAGRKQFLHTSFLIYSESCGNLSVLSFSFMTELIGVHVHFRRVKVPLRLLREFWEHVKFLSDHCVKILLVFSSQQWNKRVFNFIRIWLSCFEQRLFIFDRMFVVSIISDFWSFLTWFWFRVFAATVWGEITFSVRILELLVCVESCRFFLFISFLNLLKFLTNFASSLMHD